MCGERGPNVDHVFWECPAWEHIRNRRQLPPRAVIDALPDVTRILGVPVGYIEEKELNIIQATLIDIFMAVLSTHGQDVSEENMWLKRAGA